MQRARGEEMNKKLFCAIIAACGVCGYSLCSAKNIVPSRDYECTEQEDEVIYCLDEKGKPLTDKWYKYWENGQLSSIENFKSGYRDGLNTFFDEDGRVFERMYYKKGLKNGMYKKYYVNRTKQIQGNYEDGLLEGKLELYYLDGKLRGRMTYKRGKLQRGYCVDIDGNRVRFNNEEIGKYQNNEINMCGLI